MPEKTGWLSQAPEVQICAPALTRLSRAAGSGAASGAGAAVAMVARTRALRSALRVGACGLLLRGPA